LMACSGYSRRAPSFQRNGPTVTHGTESGYAVLAPVAFQHRRIGTAPATLATGAVSYSDVNEPLAEQQTKCPPGGKHAPIGSGLGASRCPLLLADFDGPRMVISGRTTWPNTNCHRSLNGAACRACELSSRTADLIDACRNKNALWARSPIDAEVCCRDYKCAHSVVVSSLARPRPALRSRTEVHLPGMRPPRRRCQAAV
jgi:hypothetical protein